MGWFKWKTQVNKAAEKWEQIAAEDGGADSLFRNLGKDLNEEARMKAVAIARSQYEQQPVGGWIGKEGRKKTSVGIFEGIAMFFKPGQFDTYVLLAVLSAFFHTSLLGSWVVETLSDGDFEDLETAVWKAVSADDTAMRLTTMYIAGHLLWFAVALHVLILGEVTPRVPYLMLMLVSVAIGGPTCALAMSAHCTEQARHKAAIALGAEERRAALADGLQWVYLVVFAAIVAATMSAFGEPSLDPTLRTGFDPLAFFLFYAWPIDLATSATLEWMTRLTGVMIADWVGISVFGLMLAVYSQNSDVEGAEESEGLLGSKPGMGDLCMRLAIILIGSFPNPYVGLALYLLLDQRHKSHQPLLPECSRSLVGNQQPRAMATWQAREQSSYLL